jgi:hypothetical protein
MSVHEERMIIAIDADFNQLTIVEEQRFDGRNGNVAFVAETGTKKMVRVSLAFDEAHELSRLLAAFCEQRQVK